jgi:transposase
LEPIKIIEEDFILKDSLIFVGIDVSKAQLDVAIRPTGETLSVANDKAGIKALVKRLAKIQPALVVLESTGGLERQLISALVSAEIAVVRANPRQVRDFAKATGQLAKTDSIDAEAAVASGVAELRCAALCTWQPWSLLDTIP